jgi:hypothetical protein
MCDDVVGPVDGGEVVVDGAAPTLSGSLRLLYISKSIRNGHSTLKQMEHITWT